MVALISRLMGVPLPVPDSGDNVQAGGSLAHHAKGEPLRRVVGTAGVEVFGKGERKVRQYDHCKRRTWRKWHLGVDEATREIVAAVVSTNDRTDGQAPPALLEQVDGPTSADDDRGWPGPAAPLRIPRPSNGAATVEGVNTATGGARHFPIDVASNHDPALLHLPKIPVSLESS